MFMVTQKEERAIQGIDGIYCSLQKSAKKVMAALQYNDDLIAAQNQKKSFWQRLFPKKSEAEVANQDLHELLDALDILKSIFEENTPLIIDGKLYFRFSMEQGQRLFYQTGAAQTEFDLLSYFEDLAEKMTDAMDLPKVKRAMNSPLLLTYCPAIARAKAGLRSYAQGYLDERKAESAAIQEGKSTTLRVVS